MQTSSNLSEPENKTVNPLYIRQNKETMKLGSAWASRTCPGNKHLKPHLYCDKAQCWQWSMTALHVVEARVCRLLFNPSQMKTLLYLKHFDFIVDINNMLLFEVQTSLVYISVYDMFVCVCVLVCVSTDT